MQSITFQPVLRPALPEVDGCKDYREERKLFIRIDELLRSSGLENDFIDLCIQHQGYDVKKTTAKRLDSIARHCVLALRSNIARHLKNLDHRDFCIRLADSSLLQWFLQIGRVEGVKAFAKSTSDRFAHLIDEEALRAINNRLIALLAGTACPSGPIDLGLKSDIDFDDIYFDSTCLKAPIHFPVDWVLLRDATRTLMKATALIRRAGLRHRMPQEPLAFLSDINTHCMKMTAKFRTKDGRKHRKAVLRAIKNSSNVSPNTLANTSNFFKPAVQKPTSPRTKYDKSPSASRTSSTNFPSPFTKRTNGSSEGANSPMPIKFSAFTTRTSKFSNEAKAELKLNLETTSGLERPGKASSSTTSSKKEKTSDAKQIKPALERLIEKQNLPLKNAWGDRGIHSEANEKLLAANGIRSGLCPRDVGELRDRLQRDPGLREGMKRRAGTEARVSIIIRDFMGQAPRAKGIEHRQMMVGWAVLSHNLWVLARLEQRCDGEEIEEKVPEAA